MSIYQAIAQAHPNIALISNHNVIPIIVTARLVIGRAQSAELRRVILQGHWHLIAPRVPIAMIVALLLIVTVVDGGAFVYRIERRLRKAKVTVVYHDISVGRHHPSSMTAYPLPKRKRTFRERNRSKAYRLTVGKYT